MRLYLIGEFDSENRATHIIVLNTNDENSAINQYEGTIESAENEENDNEFYLFSNEVDDNFKEFFSTFCKNRKVLRIFF